MRHLVPAFVLSNLHLAISFAIAAGIPLASGIGMRTNKLVSVLFTFCPILACGSAHDDKIVLPTEAEAFTARTSAGIPEPGASGCDPAVASWDVDLVAAKVIGDTCADSGPLHFEHSLSADELALIRLDLSHVAEGTRTTCFYDAGGMSLIVRKDGNKSHYFEGKTPCGEDGQNRIPALNVGPIIARLSALHGT